MTDRKKTNPPSFADDIAQLAERLRERQLAAAMSREIEFGDHLATLERRILAGLGVPKEYFDKCKVHSPMTHDSVVVDVPKAVVPFVHKTGGPQSPHTLQAAAKYFTGGRAKGSIPLKGQPKIDKRLLMGLLYGSHPGVSMGTPVAAPFGRRRRFTGQPSTFTASGLKPGDTIKVQGQVRSWKNGAKSGRFSAQGPNQGNQGTYKVTGIVDETQVYVDGLPGLMCQPVLNLDAMAVAGYSAACSTCPYSMQCIRHKHPNVCSCCRATVPQHCSHAMGGRHDRSIEKEFCRLQQPKERVSCACPLFQGSLMTCGHCEDETRPYVTRVLIPRLKQPQGGRRFAKKVRIRQKPKPEKNTFRTFLRSRYGRSTHEKLQQAQRRPAPRYSHRMQGKR